MINKTDEDSNYDYSPNELASLSVSNPKKYKDIVESNLERGDTVEKWEQRNLEYMQRHLKNRQS